MNSVVGPVKDAVVLSDSIDKSVVEPEHKNLYFECYDANSIKMYLFGL